MCSSEFFRGGLAGALRTAMPTLADSPCPDPLGPQVPILRHADVRRMLLRMRALTEGARALLYYTAGMVDRGALGIIRRFGQQQGRPIPAGRADNQPALAVRHRRVLHAIEAETFAIESLCAVVAIDHQTDEKEPVHGHRKGPSIRIVTRRSTMSLIEKFPPIFEGFKEWFCTLTTSIPSAQKTGVIAIPSKAHQI